MTLNEIEQFLTLAEKHVSEGAAHIKRQRTLIDDLDRGAHDSTQARQLLESMLQTQALHESDAEGLRNLWRCAGEKP